MSDNKTGDRGSLATRDPLHEISRRAQELWAEDGKPEGRSWENYVERAEEELLGGLSSGIPSGRKRTKTLEAHDTVSREMQRVRQSCSDPLTRAIAMAFSDLLTEHESFCLARLLVLHRFTLEGSENPIAPTFESIAPIFVALVGEYPQEGLVAMGVDSPAKLSSEKKERYWKGKLEEWRDTDRPLNFTDQNTMQRLHRDLLQSKMFRSIEPR